MQHDPVVITRKKAEPQVEMVNLFSIVDEETGEKTDYDMPRHVGFNLTLQGLEVLAKQGELAATQWSFIATMGQDAWDALTELDDLTEQNFNDICEIVNEIVLGPGKKMGKSRLPRGGAGRR